MSIIIYHVSIFRYVSNNERNHVNLCSDNCLVSLTESHVNLCSEDYLVSSTESHVNLCSEDCLVSSTESLEVGVHRQPVHVVTGKPVQRLELLLQS